VYDLRRGRLFSLDGRTARRLEEVLLGDRPGAQPDASFEELVEHFPFLEFGPQPLPLPRLEEAVERRPTERSGVWLEPTNRCNLRCVHCYAASGEPLPEEMGPARWREVIAQLFGAGYRHFTVCGGEPFVYPHLVQFLQWLAEGGAESITVLTNAAALDEKRVRAAAACGVSFGVTFYSHIREHHEKITQVSGSWQASVDGMRLLLRLQIPFSVNIPLGAYNEKDLEGTLDFLERLGVPRERAGGNIVYPLGRGCNYEVLPQRTTIFNVRREIYEIPIRTDGHLDYHTCWRGKLLIMADGTVTPCPSARDPRFVAGNVQHEPLSRILERKRLHELWAITLDDVSECRRCEFRFACHDCRANAFVYTGDLYAKNPYCTYHPETGTWDAPPEQALPSARRLQRAAGLQTRYRPDGWMTVARREDGAVFLFNPTGALLLEALAEPCTLEQLADLLARRFAVSEQQALEDVRRLVSESLRSGLLQWK